MSTRTTQRIGGYFREIRLINDLQMRPEERTWLARPPQDPEPKQVVLYLGCNVLRTPHMVQTVTDIFSRLGIDFVAVGGPTYCCGVPLHRDGPEEALAIGQRAAGYFGQFRPQRVVVWCPGCLHHYRQNLALNSPFLWQHVTEFLAEHVDRLRLSRPVPRRVALHYHIGSAQSAREAACARRLLKAVPELELVDIGSDRRLGRQCTPNGRLSLGPEVWDGLIRSQMEEAIALGAEVFVPTYHGCHRMLVRYQEEYPFEVEHYLSLVGHALGIDHEDRYRKYLLWSDADRILEAAAPCLEANQVDPETARPVVQRCFVERGL